jgi:prepilin-type N-terminal cleavage/methylation domain-containing protein
MQTKSYLKRPRGAFSLVELLIVIAVIGIIAAMSVMTLTDTDKNARVTAAQAQAQRIASTFAGGVATGAPGFTPANSVDTAMNAVGTGSFGTGANRGAWFQLSGITATMDDAKPIEQQAKHYLAWEDGTLIYSPDGVSGEGGGGGEVQPPPPPPENTNPWYLLMIVPTPWANFHVTNYNQSHPQNEHRGRDLGDGNSAIEYRSRQQ